MNKAMRLKEGAAHEAGRNTRWNVDKIQAACCILLSAAVSISFLFWMLG